MKHVLARARTTRLGPRKKAQRASIVVLAVLALFAVIGIVPARAYFTVPTTNACPVTGNVNITPSWGAPRGDHTHHGNDIVAESGRPLVAVEAGTIESYGPDGGDGGNRIWLRGASSSVEYYYAHLSAFVPGLGVGSVVTKGQVIGYVGATGSATGPHLHFSIVTDNPPSHEIYGSGSVDPYPYLKFYWCTNLQSPTEVGGVTLTPNADGTLELMYRGSDRQPWATHENGPGQVDQWPTGGHTQVGGQLMGNPVVARNGDGRLQMFYRGNDNQTWTTAQGGANQYGVWSNEHYPLGGSVQMPSEPAAARNFNNQIQVFYRGTDGKRRRGKRPRTTQARGTRPGTSPWTAQVPPVQWWFGTPTVACPCSGRTPVEI
jgi:hypothetical protein